jgi:hypothetical protein
MEFLKGAHYILATTLSLYNPVCFMLVFILCIGVNSLADPQAFSQPYESSLPYSFAIIYLLINYDDLSPLNFYEVVCTISAFLGMAIENYLITQEYSIPKLIIRAVSACMLLCIMVLPIFSKTIKYLSAYGIGYFLCSAVVQYYSLLTSYRKPKTEKRSKRDRNSKHVKVSQVDSLATTP